MRDWEKERRGRQWCRERISAVQSRKSSRHIDIHRWRLRVIVKLVIALPLSNNLLPQRHLSWLLHWDANLLCTHQSVTLMENSLSVCVCVCELHGHKHLRQNIRSAVPEFKGVTNPTFSPPSSAEASRCRAPVANQNVASPPFFFLSSMLVISYTIKTPLKLSQCWHRIFVLEPRLHHSVTACIWLVRSLVECTLM